MKINLNFLMNKVNSREIESPTDERYKSESKKSLEEFKKKLEKYSEAVADAPNHYVN